MAGPTSRRFLRPAIVGALVSIASAAAGLLVASVGATDAPVVAVGGEVIDRVPKALREWAISSFGTNDKLVLVVGIMVVVAALASVVAVSSLDRRWISSVAIGGACLAAVAAVGGESPTGWLAVIASGVVASGVLALTRPYVRSAWSEGRAAQVIEADEADEAGDAPSRAEPMVTSRWDAPVDRREFVTRVGAISAGSAIAVAGGSVIDRTASVSLVEAEAAFPKVPTSGADAAQAVTRGATIDRSVSPFITPVEDFYRIDTALVPPRITLADWRLTIGGAVENELSLSYADLIDRHVVERVITMCCVSNEVGGDLIGTARFLGVPLAELLDEAGVKPGGTQVAMESADGWTCGFPTEIAMDGRDALVVIGQNGKPLTVKHGFPARVVVPGLYGYVSATKWITSMTLVGLDEFDGYWIPRGWAKDGPVKTQSRIDVPRRGESVDAGRVVVAGVAWAQHRGIDRVEVRVDDGPWVEADLGDEVTIDAWRQWKATVDMSPGEHEVAVRATDRDGVTQTPTQTRVDPDGATGHHTIDVVAG